MMMMMGPNQMEPCFQTQPPIGGAPSHFEQGMMPFDMRPPLPPPPPPAQMHPPIGVYPSFEQGMMPLAPRPPPPAQICCKCCMLA
ncbi:hypothetical protein MKW92_038841 [Papaver armeniacum]|nr:hypothetical protein MKW92_038841 [Papaver armeniacum]